MAIFSYRGLYNTSRRGGKMNQEKMNRMGQDLGFIAALDQSGGSTPKALRAYGISDDAYANEEEMFDQIHEMRSRIMTDPAFNGDRIVGAILFEQTLDRKVDGKESAAYLWEEKNILPFLKVDKGLLPEEDGVQRMKEIDHLDQTLDKAVQKGVFGTKMRSNILAANEKGIEGVVQQQFDLAKKILKKGLVPIIEPEVNISIPDKEQAEVILKEKLKESLDRLGPDEKVMFKLTLPTVDGFYSDLLKDPRVLRIVALSGGYSRKDAVEKLAQNPGIIASFSRALTEGLNAQQSDQEFHDVLDDSIQQIYTASTT